MTSTCSIGTFSAPRAGPTDLPASFMYVWGSSTATRGPLGPRRPSVSRPPYFGLGLGRPQRAIRALAVFELDVVWRAGVLAAGIAHPDYQPVDAAAVTARC